MKRRRSSDTVPETRRYRRDSSLTESEPFPRSPGKIIEHCLIGTDQIASHPSFLSHEQNAADRPVPEISQVDLNGYQSEGEQEVGDSLSDRSFVAGQNNWRTWDRCNEDFRDQDQPVEMGDLACLHSLVDFCRAIPKSSRLAPPFDPALFDIKAFEEAFGGSAYASLDRL